MIPVISDDLTLHAVVDSVLDLVELADKFVLFVIPNAGGDGVVRSVLTANWRHHS